MALSKCNLTKGKELASIQESNTIEAGVEMDPNLWGDFQNHIDMKLVYKKLLLQAFFILRRVCKSWKTMACERRNFKERIPKPYFVSCMMPFTWSPEPSIVAFDIPSGRWVWNPLELVPLQNPSEPALALHRMLYSSDFVPACPRMCSISSQTRSMSFLRYVWGHIRGTACVTPHTFKLIRGDLYLGTHIFDSESDNMWTRNPLKPVRDKPCANLNGGVYMRSVAPDIFAVYDVAKAVWSELQPPQQLPRCRTYVRWLPGLMARQAELRLCCGL